MSRLVALLALALSAALALSCVSISKQMSAWEGRHIDELIEEWGEPARTEELDDGYTAYTWEFERTPRPQGSGPVTSAYRAGPATPYTALRTFLVDADGIIRKWSWEGP
jgi:hypothetical protein